MASTSSSSGTSQGTSQSTSEPVVLNTPYSDWALAQSQYYNMIADQMQDWAYKQYAKGEGVTDQTISNFMQMSGDAKGFAGRLISQYDDQIRPAMDQFFREAGSYASAERQAFEAGQAMSTMAQGQRAGTDAAINRIAAYGANPNAGGFKNQILASLTSGAEARAGAGTQAAQHTEDVGRQMLKDYIGWGQNVPGFAMNAINAGYAGLTGATNAVLGLINSGANLMQVPNAIRNTAVAANKPPLHGQKSESKSQQSSQQQSKSQQEDKPKEQKEPQERQQGAGRGPGTGSGSGDGEGSQRGIADVPGGTSRDDEGAPIDVTTRDPGYYGAVPYFDETGTVRTEFSPDIGRYDAFGEIEGPDTPRWDAEGVDNWTLPENYMPGTGFNVQSDVNKATGADFRNIGNSPWPDAPAPDAPAPEAPGPVTSGPDWNSQIGTIGGSWQDQLSGMGYGDDAYTETYDPSQYDEPGGGIDTYDDYDQYDDYYDDSNDYDGGYDASGDDYYDDSNDYSYDDSYDDSGDYSYDEGGGSDDYSYDDYSYDDYGGGYEDYGGDYARGGPVRRPPAGQARARPGIVPTTGGAVPRSASPSRGRRTDDISARLNAGEYVIPRDVVSHKGTEFFNSLIEKSRKLRTGMAGPKPGAQMKPRLPGAGRPTFRSRPTQLPPR